MSFNFRVSKKLILEVISLTAMTWSCGKPSASKVNADDKTAGHIYGRLHRLYFPKDGLKTFRESLWLDLVRSEKGLEVYLSSNNNLGYHLDSYTDIIAQDEILEKSKETIQAARLKMNESINDLKKQRDESRNYEEKETLQAEIKAIEDRLSHTKVESIDEIEAILSSSQKEVDLESLWETDPSSAYTLVRALGFMFKTSEIKPALVTEPREGHQAEQEKDLLTYKDDHYSVELSGSEFVLKYTSVIERNGKSLGWYETAFKDGKEYKVTFDEAQKRSIPRSEDDKPLAPPYVIISEVRELSAEVDGYAARSHYEKLKRSGQLSSSGRYPAALSGIAVFLKAYWSFMQVNQARITQDETSTVVQLSSRTYEEIVSLVKAPGQEPTLTLKELNTHLPPRSSVSTFVRDARFGTNFSRALDNYHYWVTNF